MEKDVLLPHLELVIRILVGVLITEDLGMNKQDVLNLFIIQNGGGNKIAFKEEEGVSLPAVEADLE